MRIKRVAPIAWKALLGVVMIPWAVVAQSAPPDREQPVEIRLDQAEIYPSTLTQPSPVGRVDENPPFLHYYKKYDDEKQRRREKLNAIFYFRLATNAAMKEPAFESGPRRWSFYCPYKPLEKGTWYWQCGVATKEAPQAITWSEVYAFTIFGQERPVHAPAYEVLEAGLIKSGHPRIECRPAEVGKLMPQDPKLAGKLREVCEAALAAPLPKTFMDFSRWDDPTVRKSGTTKIQKASYIVGDFERNKMMPLLRGYLLTGDKRYREGALAGADTLRTGYTELKANKLAEGFTVDIYGRLAGAVFDTLFNDLDADRRAPWRDVTAAEARESFQTLLDAYEHIPYNEHRWQMFIQSAFLKSIVLVGEVPEASEWMRYLYDLWNFKAPGAGRNDGGWFTGNGYFGASEGTLFVVPYLLSRHTGQDFFDIPWYQNVGKYLCHSTPPGHPAGASGDKAGGYGAPMQGLVGNLRFLAPGNPWNHRYVASHRPVGPDTTRPRDYLDSALKWYELQLRRQHPEALARGAEGTRPLDRAAFFPDTGFVAMFGDPSKLDASAMVNFTSSPFGQHGHAHAAQNAFNLTWGGKKLFFRTGYYTSSNDPSSVPNYKHSRASNTILADGIGMSMAHSGYGWVPRFLDSGPIAYCLGDASNAYTGQYGPYGEMLQQRGIAVSPENGYGNPGVTRFRRHLVFLRPGILLVYDELEAKRPVTWTFRLNAPEKITRIDDTSVAVKSSNATATAKMFASTAARCRVTDQFWGGPVVDFQRKLPTTANQWHADLDTADKAAKARLLTVLRINPGETDPARPLKITESRTGTTLTLVLDGWTITAEMDPAAPSLLSATDQRTGALLTSSAAQSLQFDGKTHTAEQKGMTLLVEKRGEGCTVQQARDTLPDAAVYSNRP